MHFFPAIISVFSSVAAGALAWYGMHSARQIHYATLADGRRAERSLPLAFRMLLPLAPNFFGRTGGASMTRARERAERMLVAAGYEGVLAGRELLALRFLMPLTFGLLWVGGARLASGAAGVSGFTAGVLALSGPLLFAAYPGLWLRRVLAARHRSIQRELPFTLDLLTLSVEAGVDFMSALQRNARRRGNSALNEELLRVIHAIQVGTPRRTALREMAERVALPDLRAVVNALVQADEMGVSLGAILRIQADQMRRRRFDRAEKLANEAPVKLLAPLMLFIFPAVFLVLLLPVLSRLLGQF